METFETYIEKERERLQKAREDALSRRKEADDQLTAIDTELQAIAAYEQVKKGKKPRQAPLPLDGEKKRKSREIGKRAEVLKLVEAYPDGVTRGELIEKLGIKGQKAPEQSLSNALSALRKGGQITLQDGTYRAA